MRNGLAIAGMAGGLFFLGQAVASATDATAGASNDVAQVNDSTGSGGSGTNLNSSSAEAKNVDTTTVDSSVTGGSGGVNSTSVNTGVLSGGPIMGADTLSTQSRPSGDDHSNDHADTHGTTVDVTTGNASVTQNANGGAVNGSGNIAVADHSGTQTATATNTVTQSNSTKADDHHGRDHRDGSKDHGSDSLSPSTNGHHEHGSNSNWNQSDSSATNVDKTSVDSTVTGGAGGSNSADINTGIIGNTFYCPTHSTCTYNFTTGDVTVYQNANGGDVNNSGNIGVGVPVPGSCTCPEKAGPAAPGAKPAVKAATPAVKAATPAVKMAAAPAKHSGAVLSSAQPSGQLAYTGSDVSLPLTVGLLALVAGLGLTVLGRRREIQTI